MSVTMSQTPTGGRDLEHMMIDDDTPVAQTTTTVNPYSFSHVVTSHARVYPTNGEPPVIPYLELPDHRPLQANLPPMTIRFKRHHIELPLEFDDTGAKVSMVNYIIFIILSQVRTLLSEEHYTKSSIPPSNEVLMLSGNQPSLFQTQNIFSSKSTTRLLSKRLSTKLSILPYQTKSLSWTKPTFSTAPISLLSSSLGSLPMIWNGLITEKSNRWLRNWPNKSKSSAIPLATLMMLFPLPRSLIFKPNLENLNSNTTRASTVFYAPPSVSSPPPLSPPKSLGSIAPTTFATPYNIAAASNIVPNAETVPAADPTPRRHVQPIGLNASAAEALGTSKKTVLLVLLNPHLLSKTDNLERPSNLLLHPLRTQLLRMRDRPPNQDQSPRAPIVPWRPLEVALSPSLPQCTPRRPPTNVARKPLLKTAVRILASVLKRTTRNPPKCLRFSILSLTIVSVNHPNSDIISLFNDVSRFRPDILLVQEAHSSNNRMVRGIPRAPLYSVNGYKFAALFHYNAIYVFNKNISLVNYHITKRYIRLTIQTSQSYGNKKANNQLIIQSCYAPVMVAERRRFFQEDGFDIQTLPSHSPRPSILLMGDFNDYPNPALDFYNGNEFDTAQQKNRLWQHYFSSTLDEANLLDAFRALHPTKQAFSRISIIHGKVVSSSRIDHALVSAKLTHNISVCDYEVCPYSDHHYMIVKLTPDVEMDLGPGRWHLHTGVTLDAHFVSQMRTFLEEVIPSLPRAFSMGDWMALKARLISCAKTVAATIGPRNKQHKLEIACLLNELNETIWTVPEQRELYSQRLNHLCHLQDLQHLHQALHMAAKFPLLHDPWIPIDNPSPFYTKRDFITEIEGPDGCSNRDIKAILKETESFYSDLYSIKSPYDQTAVDRLHSNIALKLNPNTANSLKRPLTLDEVKVGLHSCHSYSASGEDGLPFEFWKSITDLVAPLLHKALQNWNYPSRKEHFPSLTGTLIFKQGDRHLLKNYRPVSIMNADLCWNAKSETLRLTKAFSEVISYNQTAFLPGRELSDSVVAIMLLCELAATGHVTDLVILSLDQEKAYDKVSRQYLFDTLRAYGFPTEVISRLEKYYTQPAVQYKVNNYLTNPIELMTGVLQGDPLACLLYLITLQPLLDTLSKTNACTKISLPQTKKTINFPPYAFADNLTSSANSEEAYIATDSALKDHENASGGTINIPKSVAFFPNLCGRNIDPNHWHSRIPYPTHPNDQERVELGCPFRPDGKPPVKFLFELLQKIRSTAAHWFNADLCERGRVMIANSFIIGKIAHATQLCPLTPDFHMHVGDILTNLVFRSTRMAAPFKNICLPLNQRGLGLINPKYQATAMTGRIIASLFTRDSDLGKAFRFSMLEILLQNNLGVTELFNGKLGVSPGTRSYQRRPTRNPNTSSTFSKHIAGFLPKLTPFWARIFRTLVDLEMSVSRNWDEYTDDEILNLPYNVPGIASAHEDAPPSFSDILKKGVNTKCYRNQFQNIAGYRTFRDLLFFHNHTNGYLPHLRLPEKRAFLYQLRLQQLRQERRLTSAEEANISSEFSHLSRYWTPYYRAIDVKLRTRIERINQRPRTTEEFVNDNRIESLIPWRHLTLAGCPLKDYSVKKARNYQSSPETIIPNWNFTEAEAPGLDRAAELTVWRNAWANLLWKDRPTPHYSAYWRLLQNRVLLAWKPKTPGSHPTPLDGSRLSNNDARDLPEDDQRTINRSARRRRRPNLALSASTSTNNSQESLESANDNTSPANSNNDNPRLDSLKDPADRPEPEPWAIDDCNICHLKDSARHAFLLCPPVYRIWQEALLLLPGLIYGNDSTPLTHTGVTIFKVVFGFPELTKSIPKQKRRRITLWHSAVVFVINSTRTDIVWNARQRGTKAIFDWSSYNEVDRPLTKIKYEIRHTI